MSTVDAEVYNKGNESAVNFVLQEKNPFKQNSKTLVG